MDKQDIKKSTETNRVRASNSYASEKLPCA